MEAKRIVSSLCIMFVISLVAPLTLAGKKGPKVYPEIKSDAALVYLCFVPSFDFRAAEVCVDDKAFGGKVQKKVCTFDHIEPGVHFLWNIAFSKIVEARTASVFEMQFEVGQTYYLGIAVAGSRASFQLFDDAYGRQRIEETKSFDTTARPAFDKGCQKTFEKKGIKGANNPHIARRRLTAGRAKMESDETHDPRNAIKNYEDAEALFRDAASKFDELAKRAWRLKTSAIIELAMLRPHVSFFAPRTFDDLGKEYERLASEAAQGQTEARRRLVCYSGIDDAAVTRCLAKDGSGE